MSPRPERSVESKVSNTCGDFPACSPADSRARPRARTPPVWTIEGRGAMPKSQVLLVVAALSAGPSVLCDVASARPLDDVVSAGAVRIGVYRDNPPFSFRRDGKLVGVDVDIGRALAERLKG